MNIMGRKRDGALPDSIRIFTFGDVGVGKSTFLACLIRFFLESEDCLFVYDHYEKPSKNLMMLWLQRLKESKFPPTSTVGDIVNIKVGLVNDEDRFKMQFLLYEMSGEDLKKISTMHGGDFDQEFQDALDNSNVILALVPRAKLLEHEMILGEFFNFLYNRHVTKPVATIVTKWDLIYDINNGTSINKYREDEYLLEKLVKEKLKWPIKFLQVNGIFEDPAVFYFSVGSVEKDVITVYNPKGIEEIAQWVIQNSMIQKSLH